MPRTGSPLPRLRARYRLTGRWFKGALHLHTTASDGRFTLEETVALYGRADFDFICITDHNKVSRIGGLHESGMLLLDGIELDAPIGNRRALHLVVVDARGGEDALRGGIRRIAARQRHSGAIVIAAHPHWSGLSDHDLESRDFDGIEVFNHNTQREVGKGLATPHWDLLLASGREVLGFAVDDCHGVSQFGDWCGGWVMVNARALTRRDIVAAMRRGNFYSSSGPEIRSLRLGRGKCELATSPAVAVRILGQNGFGRTHYAPDGKPRRRWSLPLPSKEALLRFYRYVRIEVEDAAGKVAWTNTLYRPVAADTRP